MNRRRTICRSLFKSHTSRLKSARDESTPSATKSSTPSNPFGNLCRKFSSQTPNALKSRYSVWAMDPSAQVPSYLLSLLFEARCADLDIPVLADKKTRFLQSCVMQLSDRHFQLQEQGLGPLSMQTVIKILSHSRKFAYLNLSGNSIGEKGLSLLIKFLKNSREIVSCDISSNELPSESMRTFLDMMARQESITSLDLSSGDNKIRISGSALYSLKNCLQENSVLSHLNLAGSLFCKEGFLKLAEGLKHNKVLVYVNLSNNSISDGNSQLFKAISCTNIEDLNLSKNKLSNTKPIEHLLKSSNSLKKLDISKNMIKECNGLFEVLAFCNSKLNHLNISYNKLSYHCDTIMMEFMKSNNTLWVLNLSSCEFSSAFLPQLGRGLAFNKGLTNLVLSNNNICDDSLKFISDGLRINTTLKQLSLNANKISNSGCNVLSSALAQNSSINKLNLALNPIKGEGLDSLYNLVIKRQNIYAVNVEFSEGEFKLIKQINQRCKENYSNWVKNTVPQIQESMEELKNTRQNIEEVHTRTKKQKKQKHHLSSKLKSQIMTLRSMKIYETRRFFGLSKEYAILRHRLNCLNKQQNELKSKQSQVEIKHRFLVKDINRKIKLIDNHITQLSQTKSLLLSRETPCNNDVEVNPKALEDELAKCKNSLEVANIILKNDIDKRDRLQKMLECKHKRKTK